MKIAIVGSRSISGIDLGKYIPECDEIVTGGAKGIDSLAEEYARSHGLRLTVFKPEYTLYGKAAPIVRNKYIVNYCDRIIAFWDGKSRGTKSTIDLFEKLGKHIRVIIIEPEEK